MDWKKIGKALLFPHMAVLFILFPISLAALICATVLLDTGSVGAIAAYVLSAYTLTIWCFRIPYLIRFYKTFKNENPYIRRWQEDAHLRVNVSLYGTLMFNGAYSVLHLCLGLWHSSFWYCSLAGYYISLAFVRFYLVRHSRKHKPGEKMLEELRKYRACGIILLIMNMALSLMIFFMVYWNRTFIHHEITTIALAAYTFTTLTVAIVNIIKYRKYNSPVYSASKAISLAAACVSMLTMESTMLTTFNDGTMTLTARRVMLGCSGGVVSVFIIAMAIYMIVQATARIKLMRSDEGET